jgi:hypothetical protein
LRINVSVGPASGFWASPKLKGKAPSEESNSKRPIILFIKTSS